MAEDPSSHRLRWIVLAMLLGSTVYLIRSRQASTAVEGAGDTEPWLPPPIGDTPEMRVCGTAQLAMERLQELDAEAAPPPAPSVPAPIQAAADAPTTEMPIVDAPAGTRPSPRPRRSVVAEIPGTAVAALPDGSPPGPEFTIKAKAGSELFHGPDSPYFGRTRAEFWFRTAADARAAGFTAWTPRRRATG